MDRQFAVYSTVRAWIGAIAYIPTGEVWLYSYIGLWGLG